MKQHYKTVRTMVVVKSFNHALFVITQSYIIGDGGTSDLIFHLQRKWQIVFFFTYNVHLP